MCAHVMISKNSFVVYVIIVLGDLEPNRWYLQHLFERRIKNTKITKHMSINREAQRIYSQIVKGKIISQSDKFIR